MICHEGLSKKHRAIFRDLFSVSVNNVHILTWCEMNAWLAENDIDQENLANAAKSEEEEDEQ
jgi:hypothetical protein